MKNNYFYVEGVIDGIAYNTQKFNEINDEHGVVAFADIFQISSVEDAKKYKDIEDFIAVVSGMSEEFFKQFGELDDNSIIITAIDKETDVFQWGVKVIFSPNNEEEFEYQFLDWKKDGYVLKYQDVEITDKWKCPHGRKMLMLSNDFRRIINKKLVTVESVELKYEDVDETKSISPEKFISDLENYTNAGIFSDTIDFYYQITEDNSLIVTANDISTGCLTNFFVKLQLVDGVDMAIVIKELRKTVFDRFAEKNVNQK